MMKVKRIKEEFDFDWEELVDVFDCKRKIKDKYIYIKYNNQWIPEHRLKMNIYIGRELENDEIVHHIDLDGKNNKIDNLIIVSPSEHSQIHGNIHSIGNILVKKAIKNKEVYFNEFKQKYKIRELTKKISF